MRRQLRRMLSLIKHLMSSIACSAARSMRQMPTPSSSRYSCTWKEASSSSQILIKARGH
ncbi:Bgt-50455 [Blumeria graminis f. sp. tritici]|uniref:Bgt-50455 n=1 Tax=Blumeria graminis f. sp. tritici TaxID=62690 RepID=A0A9X9LAA4_BLUGR|nr:Bgt-50455 [Blumeria graminis f. sp. tritici]